MKKYIIILCTITLCISSTFAMKYFNESKPKNIIVQSVLNAPIKSSFKLLDIKYELAIEKLEEHHIRIIDSKNINELAKAYEIKPLRIIEILKG